MPVIHIICFTLTRACRRWSSPLYTGERGSGRLCPALSHTSLAGRVREDSDQSRWDRRGCSGTAAFPTWRDHLQLSAAAGCLAATVGAARVGALVPGPQVMDQQSAIWRLVDTVAVGPDWQPVPGGGRV